MKHLRWYIFAVLSTACLIFIISTETEGSHLCRQIGSFFTPSLRIWNNENRATGQFIVLDNTGDGAFRGFSVVQPGQKYGWGAGFASRVDSPGAEGVGVSGYAETGVAWAGAWGANLFARSYHPYANAFGAEIAGGNFADDTPVVYGVYVVMEGTSPTKAGVVIEPSLAFPEGRPEYGVWVKENEKGKGARKVGILIDKVDSGEALKVQSGERIVLSGDGEVYMRYNETTDRVEVVKRGKIVLSR